MPPKFDLTAETKSLEKKESSAKHEISNLFDVERRIEMDNLDQQFSKLFPLEQITENIYLEELKWFLIKHSIKIIYHTT